MDKCPVCFDGRTITKVSAAGDETYCTDCRKIVASAILDFKFAASEVACEMTVNGVTMPGYKGPGKKAQCHTYDPSKPGSEEAAKKKAHASEYSTQHKKAASKIINATAGFTGAPSSVLDPATTPGKIPPSALEQGQSAAIAGSASPIAGAPLRGIGVDNRTPNPLQMVTAPGSVQPGDLNQSNPLNAAN